MKEPYWLRGHRGAFVSKEVTMKRFKLALLVMFAVSVVSLGAGCFIIAGEHRGERHGGYREPVVRSRVVIIVDEVWIHSHGPADLYIDGRFYGRVSGRMEIDVDEGEHNLEFRHKGLSPHSEHVSVRRGQPLEIRPRFKEEREDQGGGRGRGEGKGR